MLTGDGNQRSLSDWIDRETFSARGHLGEVPASWRFQIAKDKISRIDGRHEAGQTGRLCAQSQDQHSASLLNRSLRIPHRV
jgi:hypothetical protein